MRCKLSNTAYNSKPANIKINLSLLNVIVKKKFLFHVCNLVRLNTNFYEERNNKNLLTNMSRVKKKYRQCLIIN